MATTLNTHGEPSSRMHSIQRVLLVVLLLNLAVALAKLMYGTATQSAAMQADGLHSIFDSAGNVVGLIGIALASRPADEGHPYGHAKFETYASLAIGIMLVFAAFEIGAGAVERLQTGAHVTEVTPVSFIVMVATLAVNLSVSHYENKRGVELKSEVLRADARHTLSDALVSTGVIVGLALVALGYPIADAIVALLVMVAILATAFDVFKSALATLSDAMRIPEEELLQLALSVPGVETAHHIRSRGTEGEVYADLHVLVDPRMPVLEAHTVAERVQAAIQSAHPNVAEVLVHIEPNDGHVD